MTTLLIATRNTHKVREIQTILGDSHCFLTLDDFPGAPKVVEDADTFAGNAQKKAVELAKWLTGRRSPAGGQIGWPDFVLADDSGLEVDVLNGAPGVHSARFAALDGGVAGASSGNSPDMDNNAKLLRLLKDVKLENRSGRFRCVIALVPVPEAHRNNASPVCYANEFEAQIFDGACEGRIQSAPRGGSGFGYDPLFVPDGYEQSFAELGEEVKNELSHRAKALAKLKKFFAAGGC